MYQGTGDSASTVRQALRQAPALGEPTVTYQGTGEAGSTGRKALREGTNPGIRDESQSSRRNRLA